MLRLLRRSTASIGFILRHKHSDRYKNSVNIDLSSPHLWYDGARLIKGKIICHIGPTNSGKTYAALQRLRECERGIYCGPLRLLAWEVCENLRSDNIKCDLVTGNEQDYIPEGSTHISSTTEMVDLKRTYNVAVIDEAQLIGDMYRGWAWTQAFLGLKAKEIHLCGSSSMLPIINNLITLTSDSIEIINYTRLSPLKPIYNALKTYKHIQDGDCVIAFSRKELFNIKKQIEHTNKNHKCCLIYGGKLPTDTRATTTTTTTTIATTLNII